MNNIKDNKGISLVALVITIIVLLILAGVALTLTFGDNGIMTKANEAKMKTEISQAEETIKLKIADMQVKKNGNATLDNINEIETDLIKIDQSNEAIGIIYDNKYIFDIDEHLNVSEGRQYAAPTPTRRVLTKAVPKKEFDDFNEE